MKAPFLQNELPKENYWNIFLFMISLKLIHEEILVPPAFDFRHRPYCCLLKSTSLSLLADFYYTSLSLQNPDPTDAKMTFWRQAGLKYAYV